MSNRNKITCGCKTFKSAMILQLEFKKWRLTQLAKLDKVYINDEWTRIFTKL